MKELNPFNHQLIGISGRLRPGRAVTSPVFGSCIIMFDETPDLVSFRSVFVAACNRKVSLVVE